MSFVRSAGALMWRRCALRSFSPPLALPSLCRLRRRAWASPYLACVCLRVWAYQLPFLCPLACGLWFGGGGVCSPLACGSLLLVSWFPGFIPSLLSAWAAH